MPALQSSTSSSLVAGGMDLDRVPEIIGQSLDQAQRSGATHRKNIAILHKLLHQCANIVDKLPNGKGTKLSGEKAFVDALKGAVNKVVAVKKGVQQADRCVKFISGLVAYTVERAAENEDGGNSSSPASRLTSSMLKHLLKGFEAKDKTVRFRCTQFVATMITGLGELDDDDYASLKAALLERVNDKEAIVRVQAVVALAKLQNPDDLDHINLDAGNESDDEEEGENPIRVLVEKMKYDPSGEVRRAAMAHITLHPATLSSILSRARDIDPLNRKFLYTSILRDIPHMAVLSLPQRELIIRHGCKDREEAVKKAARALVARWAGELPDAGGLVEFVGLFDTMGKTKIAEDALNTVIELRQDLANQLEFPDIFWSDLSPESALLARVYAAYCKDVNDELRLEACLPVITALAFRIQDLYTHIAGQVPQIAALPPIEDLDEDEAEDAETAELRQNFRETVFITDQLLKIALMEDYGDEIGRRKMFTLIRDMVSDPNLPSELIAGCMDVLLKLSSHEKDFMRVVVEIVQNIREDVNNQPGHVEEDDDEEELDLDTATVEDIAEDQRKRQLKAAIRVQNQQLDPDRKENHIRCLAIVRALLERVAGSVQENATLLGMIHELIVPSVKSKEPEIREEGLLCLGLCSLLDKAMALDAFGLYVHQSQETEGELQVKIFQIVFDILMLYGLGFLESKGHGADVVIEFILHALNQDSHQVQATAAIGIAKLMLSGMITDSEVLKRLVLVYFAPETLDNLELRQCLSYFFPVYCYSLSANMQKMREIFIPTFSILAGVYEDLDDPSAMVSPTQLLNQLLDWTDPQKSVATEGNAVDECVQVDLAMDILKEIYREKQKDARKTWCQLLGKLYIPESIDENRLKNLLLLISQMSQHRPIKDSVTRNALTKFETGLKKLMKKKFPVLDGEEFDQMLELYEAEHYAATASFLKEVQEQNDALGSDEDSFVQTSAKKKKPAPRKRAISQTPSASGRRGARASSVASSSKSSAEPEEAPDADTSMASTGSRRSGRKAKPVVRKPQPVIEEEDEDESDDSGDESVAAALAAVDEDSDDTM